MSTIYIRDVSEETLTVLKVRAAKARQSLQAYMRDLIEREATTPTLQEVIAQIRKQATTDLSGIDVTAVINAGRERR